MEKFTNILKKFTRTFLLTFILCYLGYHLVNGESGIFNYVQKKNELEEINKKLVILERKRSRIENKINRLNPASLDADLLDEQYRRATGKIQENEVIYYY